MSIALLFIAVYVPPIADVLGVTAPGLAEWLLIAVGALTTWIVGQVVLTIQGRRGAPQPR